MPDVPATSRATDPTWGSDSSAGRILQDESTVGRRRADAVKREGRRRPKVPAPRGPPPAVAIPGELHRTANPEVRPGAEAPHPRSHHPGPTGGWVINVGVRLTVSVRWHVRIVISVRHPDPAVLLRVDPLPRRNRRLRRPSLVREWRLGRSFCRRWLTRGRRRHRSWPRQLVSLSQEQAGGGRERGAT
jgi:hypothetical protein